MLKAIITYLNLKLNLLNYFDLTRCLVELKSDNEGNVAPREYIGGGDWQEVNFDEYDGVSYWRLRDEITSDRAANIYKAGKRIETTVPLRLVFSVRKEKLTEDDAYSFDRIRQTMLKQFTIDDDTLVATLGAERVRIDVVSSDSNAKSVWDEETEDTGTFEPKYEVVFGAIDIDVVITYKHNCLPTECDDVDSDILHAFDFCNSAVVSRLTDTQVTCLQTALCGSCADATVQLNGQTVGTIPSGDTDSFPVTQDGSPVGSWNGSAWIVPSCPAGGGSIETTVSDSNPSLGDTITITGTASGYTPDSYLFFAYDGTSEVYFIAEQASNSFDWQILGLNAGTYTIYVLGVENGTPDITAFGTVDITLSVDFLLDQTYGQDIDVAFAFYKVRAAFNDYVAIIRRDSDNAQDSWKLDSNGVLSLSSENVSGTTTLGDWIGVDNGYLVTWKDQSALGLTATNSNAIDQAQIISLGALITLNGIPCADRNNWGKYTISSSITTRSLFAIGENSLTGQNVVQVMAGGAGQGFYYSGTGSFAGIGLFVNTTNGTTSINDTNPHFASYILDDGIYVDGVSELSFTSITDMTISAIGNRSDSFSRPFYGKICALFFSSQYLGAERTDIEANINSNFTPSLLP